MCKLTGGLLHSLIHSPVAVMDGSRCLCLSSAYALIGQPIHCLCAKWCLCADASRSWDANKLLPSLSHCSPACVSAPLEGAPPQQTRLYTWQAGGWYLLAPPQLTSTTCAVWLAAQVAP